MDETKITLGYAKNKYHEHHPKVLNPITIDSFLSSFRKGSKKFRIILTQQSINDSDSASLGTVTTFYIMPDVIVSISKCCSTIFVCEIYILIGNQSLLAKTVTKLSGN
jgi:hypothetical protein